MDSAEDNPETAFEKEVGENNTDTEAEDGESSVVKTTGLVRKLKLKELPSVHKAKKKAQSLTEIPSESHSWTIGGNIGSRGAVLLFRCTALSNPPLDPPANQLHMTYKTLQAETKLLAAILNSHGFREAKQDRKALLTSLKRNLINCNQSLNLIDKYE